MIVVYAKFSDDWADQPVILSLTATAFRAYTESVLYVARYTTDGDVPAESVKARDRKAAPELTAKGLWEPRNGGWHAPHWREHVPSRADLAKARSVAADRQRRHRGR